MTRLPSLQFPFLSFCLLPLIFLALPSHGQLIFLDTSNATAPVPFSLIASSSVMPFALDMIYNSTAPGSVNFSIFSVPSDSTDVVLFYVPSSASFAVAPGSAAACTPATLATASAQLPPGGVALQPMYPSLAGPCNYTLSYAANAMGLALISYVSAIQMRNVTFAVGITPSPSTPTLLAPSNATAVFNDTTRGTSVSLSSMMTTLPFYSTAMQGSMTFSVNWAGISWTAVTATVPAGVQVNSTTAPMCSPFSNTTYTSLTLSYYLPSCSYTVRWPGNTTGTLTLSIQSATGWNTAAVMPVYTTNTVMLPLMAAATSSSSGGFSSASSPSSASSASSASSPPSSSSQSSASSASSSLYSSSSSPFSSASSMSSPTSSSLMSTSVPSSTASSSSTGVIAVDGGSSGSNSAAGTAIGVILILAFLAVVGFIVYKKYIAKKTVIVSGIDMTTPRMSRKGSYKGVVGNKPDYPTGPVVENDDEVVGEEDEEPLEGEEEEAEGEEEAEDEETDVKVNRARRAV